MKRIACLAVLLPVIAACGDDGTEPPITRQPLEYGGGEFTQLIQSGGAQRAYLVVVPPSARSEVAAPLLLVLHGENQSVEEVRAMSQMDQVAGDRGWIIAYAQATFGVWAISGQRFPGTAGQLDEIFFLDILDLVDEDLNIDRSRVYVVGFSNGGLMAQRTACTMAPTVAGVGAVAASVTALVGAGCVARPTTHVAMFMGTEDEVYPWEGDVEPGRGDREFGGPESADWWAGVNECEAERTVTQLPDVADDGTTVERWVHDGCLGGAEVRFYAIEGGGHQWPGSPVELDPADFGARSRDISASRELIDFFDANAPGGG